MVSLLVGWSVEFKHNFHVLILEPKPQGLVIILKIYFHQPVMGLDRRFHLLFLRVSQVLRDRFGVGVSVFMLRVDHALFDGVGLLVVQRVPEFVVIILEVLLIVRVRRPSTGEFRVFVCDLGALFYFLGSLGRCLCLFGLFLYKFIVLCSVIQCIFVHLSLVSTFLELGLQILFLSPASSQGSLFLNTTTCRGRCLILGWRSRVLPVL